MIKRREKIIKPKISDIWTNEQKCAIKCTNLGEVERLRESLDKLAQFLQSNISYYDKNAEAYIGDTLNNYGEVYFYNDGTLSHENQDNEDIKTYTINDIDLLINRPKISIDEFCNSRVKIAIRSRSISEFVNIIQSMNRKKHHINNINSVLEMHKIYIRNHQTMPTIYNNGTVMSNGNLDPQTQKVYYYNELIFEKANEDDTLPNPEP